MVVIPVSLTEVVTPPSLGHVSTTLQIKNSTGTRSDLPRGLCIWVRDCVAPKNVHAKTALLLAAVETVR